MACSLGFYGDGISSWVVSCQSFQLKVLPGGTCNRSAKMDSSEEDSGRLVGHMDWRLLSPFDLYQIFPVGGSLLVQHSLPGCIV